MVSSGCNGTERRTLVTRVAWAFNGWKSPGGGVPSAQAAMTPLGQGPAASIERRSFEDCTQVLCG